jgi:hypothetical protein
MIRTLAKAILRTKLLVVASYFQMEHVETIRAGIEFSDREPMQDKQRFRYKLSECFDICFGNVG